MAIELLPEQKAKLAEELRALAYEFAEGNGPQLEAWSWCGCAVGTAMKRAGVARSDTSTFSLTEAHLAREIDALLPDPEDAEAEDIHGGIVTLATLYEMRTSNKIQGALVFPLLALADELETAP